MEHTPEPVRAAAPPGRSARSRTGGADVTARAASLERLATALSGYNDLAVTVRTDGPSPCLTVRNTAVPVLSETIAVSRSGDGLAFVWSWGKHIGDTSDPDRAAQAVAYVLAARDAKLSG